MTTEKRGTSAEYGQEKLRERAAQLPGDETSSLKQRFSKKTLTLLIAGLVAVASIGAFTAMRGKQVKEPSLSIVDVTKGDINVNPDVAKKHSVEGTDTQDDDVNAPEPTLTLPVANAVEDDEKSNPSKDADTSVVAIASTSDAGTASSDNLGEQIIKMATSTPPAPQPAEPLKTAIPATQSLAETIKAQPGFTDGSEPSQQNPQSGSTAVIPAENIVNASEPTPTGNIKATANPASTITNPEQSAQGTNQLTPPPVSSSSASVEGQAVAESAKGNDHKQYDPAEFGYTEPPQNVAEAKKQPVAENYVPQQLVVQEPSTITGEDLDYSGHFKTVEYNTQSQNTLYVYSTFSTKVFLLPISPKEKVHSYLSDDKGWKVTLLPGNVLRVQRSDNKAAWTQATDLFVLSGDRRYSLILQAVGEPEKRTDALQFTKKELSQQAEKQAKKTKA